MHRENYFLDPTCKLYLPFDLLDGASFASREQYGHIVTNNGAVRRLNSMSFDGDDNFMEVDTDILDLTSENFTLVGSFNIQGGIGANKYLLSRGRANYYGYYLILYNDGRILFITNQGGASQYSSIAAADVIHNEWGQIAVVRKGSSCRMFVNGADLTDRADIHINPATTTLTFKVGSYHEGTLDNFQGWCKFVAIYKEAKPASWIRSLYEEGF